MTNVGFDRYNCVTSAEVATAKSNGFWIEDRKLYVKFVVFKEQGKKPWQKRIGQVAANSLCVYNRGKEPSLVKYSNLSGESSKRGEVLGSVSWFFRF